ncbi:hypothetical protein, partial [Microcella frigidaquae]|uniref:hypothetical protein n=1 Tax=Microcella frigidaquae TaxID=424758 RepID=UPI0031DBA6E4
RGDAARDHGRLDCSQLIIAWKRKTTTQRDVAIEDRFLATERDKHQFWLSVAGHLAEGIKTAFASGTVQYQPQGTPDLAGFAALWNRDASGNGWFALVGEDLRSADWLVWYGYRSTTMADLSGNYARTPFPSLFLSRRDDRPGAPHPFRRVDESEDRDLRPFDEIGLFPGRSHPVAVRKGLDVTWLNTDEAGASVAALLS